MNVVRPNLSSEDFLAWAEAQERGKYELWRGEIVAMSPERHIHSLVKSKAGFALHDAVQKAKLDCRVLIDGPAIVINQDTTFEPDVLVECGPEPDADSLISVHPVIVIEVLSPSTRHIDKIAKLNAYASVPSLQHYLIIDPDRQIVVHQRRTGASRFETTLLYEGKLRLAPPGIEVTVKELLAG